MINFGTGSKSICLIRGFCRVITSGSPQVSAWLCAPGDSPTPHPIAAIAGDPKETVQPSHTAESTPGHPWTHLEQVVLSLQDLPDGLLQEPLSPPQTKTGPRVSNPDALRDTAKPLQEMEGAGHCTRPGQSRHMHLCF